MDPIKVNVSVEVNLSQATKDFISQLFSIKAQAPQPQVVQAPQPQVVQAPQPQVVQAPQPQVVQAPQPQVVQAPQPQVSAITIEMVRKELAAKVNAHREEIKAKLNSFGAPSVTKLDPSYYKDMYTFLVELA